LNIDGKRLERPLSKALTYILRHGAVDMGMNMTDEGFVKVSQLLRTDPILRIQANLDDVVNVINRNVNMRFMVKTIPKSQEITIDNAWMRANQGHTIRHVSEEKMLTRLTFPYNYQKIIHGTYNH